MSKTVFITGGASGIGAATVRKFCDEGWNVAFTDIQKPAEALKDALFIQADSSRKTEMEQAVKKAAEHFGSINALFCNSGIHRRNTILDITQEELDLVIQTNIYGTTYTLQAVLPYIIQAGGGAVVLNSSDQFFVGKAHSYAYGMTKGAIGQIARSLAIDLGPYNIRVNAICPGTIHTPLVDKLFAKFSEQDHKTIEQYWEEENALFARKQAGKPE